MSSDPELPADADGPVTKTVTRRIKQGHEAAYEAFLAGISGAARTFPGYLGIEIFRPAPGSKRRVPDRLPLRLLRFTARLCSSGVIRGPSRAQAFTSRPLNH
jgi:hypothetical protein